MFTITLPVLPQGLTLMREYKFRVNDDTKYFIEGMVEIESLGKLVLAQAPLTPKTKQDEAFRS